MYQFGVHIVCINWKQKFYKDNFVRITAKSLDKNFLRLTARHFPSICTGGSNRKLKKRSEKMRLLFAPKMTNDEKVIIVVKFATGFVCLSLFLNTLLNYKFYKVLLRVKV